MKIKEIMCVEYLAPCQKSRLLLTFMIYVHWAFGSVLRFVKGGKVKYSLCFYFISPFAKIYSSREKQKGFFFLHLKFSKRSPDKTFKRII